MVKQGYWTEGTNSKNVFVDTYVNRTIKCQKCGGTVKTTRKRYYLKKLTIYWNWCTRCGITWRGVKRG